MFIKRDSEDMNYISGVTSYVDTPECKQVATLNGMSNSIRNGCQTRFEGFFT